jgi:hypothetical protein
MFDFVDDGAAFPRRWPIHEHCQHILGHLLQHDNRLLALLLGLVAQFQVALGDVQSRLVFGQYKHVLNLEPRLAFS